MDPLSIGVAATSITFNCVKVASTLYTFIEESRSVDANIKGLHDEALGLSRISDAIHKTWTGNVKVTAACAKDETELWSSVKASLDDCQEMVARLSESLHQLDERNMFERGIFKKAVRTARLNMRTKDIDQYRHVSVSLDIPACVKRIFSKSNSPISRLQLDDQASLDTIAHNLKDLKEYMRRSKSATEPGEAYDPLANLDETEKKASRNLQRFLNASESFHSSASTIIDGARSTIYEGSIMGEPLTAAKKESIRQWIPPIAEVDEAGQQTQQMKPQTSRSRLGLNRIKLLVQNLLKQAVAHFESESFATAEEFLRTTLKYYGQNSEVLVDVSAVNISLAYVCSKQNKWDDVEIILIPGQGIGARDEILKLDLLAILHNHRANYETGIEWCEQAIEAKSIKYGDAGLPVHYSMFLVAKLYESNGEGIEAQGWRGCIPDTVQPPRNDAELFAVLIAPSLEHIAVLPERLLRAQDVWDMDRPAPSPPPKPPTLRSDNSAASTAKKLSREEHGAVPSGVEAMGNNNAFSKGKEKNTSHTINTRTNLVVEDKDAVDESPARWKASLRAAERANGQFVQDQSQKPLQQEQNLRQQAIVEDRAARKAAKKALNADRNERPAKLALQQRQTVDLPRHQKANLTNLLANTARKQVLKQHRGGVTCIALSLDGTEVASGSKDSTIITWSFITGKVKRKYTGHNEKILSVAYSPDRTFVASSSWDETVRLWTAGYRPSLALISSDRKLVSGHRGRVTQVMFSRDGKLLGACLESGSVVILWNVETGAIVRTINQSSAESFTFSPDNNELAVASFGGTIRFWDLETGCEAPRKAEVSENMNSITFSPNGRLLACALKDDWSVKLVDTISCEVKHTFNGHKDWVRSVAFFPDGKVLASASDDYKIKLWDADTLSGLGTLEGHENHVTGLAISRDGQFIVSGSEDGTVRVWHL